MGRSHQEEVSSSLFSQHDSRGVCLTIAAGTVRCWDGSFSEWQAVTSGVPQGSVLGPQLFTIYINDLDEGIQCNISKFADDTKLGGIVRCEEDAWRLQGDLDRLSEWVDAWQMQYNVDKCEVIHIGGKNMRVDYYLNGGRLGKGGDATRPGCHGTPVIESRHAGAAGSEESKWYVSIHSERI